MFLSTLHGAEQLQPPAPTHPRRLGAVAAVNGLYSGFIERFGATDCRTLTGLDLSEPQALETLFDQYASQGLGHTCFQQMRYVLGECLGCCKVVKGEG